MAVGYLVALGDGTLDSGDGISANQSAFTSSDVIGTGSWTWSGQYQGDGQTYSNVTDTGTYHYGSDGNVYFVPDTWYTTSGSASATTIPANSMSGTSGNDTISGDANDNVIYGGDGDDYLTGSSGDDIIFGGEGSDNYDTDTGNDTFYGEGGDDWVAIYDNMDGESLYGGETGETLGDMLEVYGDYAGVDVNVTFTGDGDGTVTFGGQTAYFWEFERFYLHSGDDTLDGSAATSAINVQTGGGDNSVTGGMGDDTISTGAGADTVDGGAGADSIDAGSGDDVVTGSSGDTLLGGAGNDQITINAASGGSVAPSGATVVTDGGSASGDYDSNDFAWNPGSSSSSSISMGGTPGTTGSDDVYDSITVLNTTDGAFLGVSQFDVGIDKVYLSEEPVSFTNTLASSGVSDFVVTYANGNTQSFRFYNDGGAAISDPAQFFGTSVISGATLSGGEGDDTLTGGYGADSIDGGDGQDQIILQDGFGNDTITGGEGGVDQDSLDLSQLSSGAVITMSGPEAGTVTVGSDTAQFSEIESITGTDKSDYIDGSAQSGNLAYVNSGGGDDTILGGSGNDDLRGGAGNDRLEGRAGTDDLRGGAGDDYLDGGTGGDYIDAGTGSDTVIGGTGDDTIQLTADADRDEVILEDGSGSDLIYNFDLGDSGDGTTVDQLDVSGLTNLAGDPVKIGDIVVTDTNGDGTGDAIMTFPNGESITLVGVQRSQVDNGPEMHAMGIPCFTAGTLIDTPTGPVRAEELSPGDYVTTLGAGVQRVLWVGASFSTTARKQLPEALMPVRLNSDAFGSDEAPVVSPQHCILMKYRSSGRPLHLRAKHLAQMTDFASFACEMTQVTYVHILLKTHDNLMSNGIPSETFYPGPMAVATLRPADRLCLYKCLPQLILYPVEQAYGPRILPVLARREVRSLSDAGELVPWRRTDETPDLLNNDRLARALWQVGSSQERIYPPASDNSSGVLSSGLSLS
ncbi:Hint domain-containing protein [Phaeobacter inhibens]|uniref:Hint domain-containing protein n=1 Tax=Phaeobacter inhibens TaxID=221822 RepID=UPI0021A8DE52|nr:Hint domain-containing protein [Phaeobacter inhibens]UWS00515.1 Hint domain-containing protein [Phaeobacter inhibens]